MCIKRRGFSDSSLLDVTKTVYQNKSLIQSLNRRSWKFQENYLGIKAAIVKFLISK